MCCQPLSRIYSLTRQPWHKQGEISREKRGENQGLVWSIRYGNECPGEKNKFPINVRGSPFFQSVVKDLDDPTVSDTVREVFLTTGVYGG